MPWVDIITHQVQNHNHTVYAGNGSPLRSKAGNYSRVNTALTSIPPTITAARPRYTSVPAPGINNNGSMPNTLVRVAISIGHTHTDQHPAE
jgi:hypothetical protein